MNDFFCLKCIFSYEKNVIPLKIWINIGKFDKDKSNSIFLKGQIYYELNRLEEACLNWEKSSKMGYLNAKENIEKFCY